MEEKVPVRVGRRRLVKEKILRLSSIQVELSLRGAKRRGNLDDC